MDFKRGDIVWLRGGFMKQKNIQSLESRPAIVVQNDIGNEHSPTLIIIPGTSKKKKASQPTHIMLSRRGGMQEDSVFLAEQIQTINKDIVDHKIGKCSADEMDKVDEILSISISLRSDVAEYRHEKTVYLELQKVLQKHELILYTQTSIIRCSNAVSSLKRPNKFLVNFYKFELSKLLKGE